MRKLQGKIKNDKLSRTYRRKLSIRKKISGTAIVPRLSISKGIKNIYVQVIDDTSGVTIASSRTFGKAPVGERSNVASGKLIGKDLSEKLKSKNIANVVFDRNGLKYCGVVASIATALRESGIKL